MKGDTCVLVSKAPRPQNVPPPIELPPIRSNLSSDSTCLTGETGYWFENQSSSTLLIQTSASHVKRPTWWIKLVKWVKNTILCKCVFIVTFYSWNWKEGIGISLLIHAIVSISIVTLNSTWRFGIHRSVGFTVCETQFWPGIPIIPTFSWSHQPFQSDKEYWHTSVKPAQAQDVGQSQQYLPWQ